MKAENNRGWNANTTGILAFVMVILIVTGGGWVAAANGYIPIKTLDIFSSLKEVPPPGNAIEITINQAIEGCPANVKKMLDNATITIPHYNDILIKLYSTNATPFQVLEFYSNRLSDKGYDCIKVGMLFIDDEFGYLSTAYHSGDSCVDYYGYSKGLTAVGIIIVSDGSANCLVLYTSGYIIYYQDIVQWLQHPEGYA